MILKKIISLFALTAIIVVSFFGLIGCDRGVSVVPDTPDIPAPSESDTSPPRGTSHIRIGLITASTGRYAETYGVPMQHGFELAREEINAAGLLDAELTFLAVDDQSTVEGAQAAVQHLVDQDVPVMVGIAISTQLKDAFPIAQANGVVAFSPVSAAAGLSGIGDFIFRAALATDLLIPVSVVVTQRELGYRTAATIYDEADVFSTSSNVEISTVLTENGVDIRTVQTFLTGDTDFSEQVAAIVASAPDAVFISGFEQETAQIIREVQQRSGTDTPYFIAPNLSRDELQLAGDAADGVITFASWSRLSDTPGNRAFIERYRARYGRDPEVWAAQSYATLHILAAALADAGTTDSAAIRDALAQIADLPTILGDFSFDPNGEAFYAPVVLIVRDGELQTFEQSKVVSVLRDVTRERFPDRQR